jgi:xylulokinase
MRTHTLVIDIGSTKLKAAMHDGIGGLTGVCSADSPLQADEVQAIDVLAAVMAMAERCCQGVVPAAIAITGATRTHVLTGPDGRALESVIKLDDSRGAEFEAQIRQAYGDGQGSAGVGAYQPMARALDFKKRRPDLHAAARWQLELKDWLNLQLTGVAATDPVSYARMLPPGTHLAGIASRLAISPSLFADAVPSAMVMGSVRPNVDRRFARWVGVPVVQCGFDAWCASFGMGCVAEGQTYNVSGTTEVFGSFRTEFCSLAGVSCLQWTPELFHLGGPCQTGLATLSWFGRTFLNDSNPQAVLDCAARAQDDCPLCVPFISGERMPFWKPDLSAQFLQVRSHHGLPEFARALLDGLMVFQRYLLSMLAPKACGLHLSGGGSGLAGWAQYKADAFGLPVTVLTEPEPGLLGAAMCAMTALGTCATIAQAQAALETSGIVTYSNVKATQRMLAVEMRLLPYLVKIAEEND